MVKKIAFEKAIAVDKVDKTLAEMFKDLESIAIEDDYTGPKLDNGKVTATFMEELLDWYRQQKKLHRKYAYKVSSRSSFLLLKAFSKKSTLIFRFYVTSKRTSGPSQRSLTSQFLMTRNLPCAVIFTVNSTTS